MPSQSIKADHVKSDFFHWRHRAQGLCHHRPTSGIGLATAKALARRGTVVLIGRDRARLDAVKRTLEQQGHEAVSIPCDLASDASVRRASAEIVALNLPIAALVNNAGIRPAHATKNAQDWDMTFATNHLGPFALTEALVPHLRDGANVVFVVSAVENPDRKPVHAAGFRGERYLSAQASARGEWKAGGSVKPGFDDCATSKQALLAAALAFARETPRLRFNAVEPGVTPATGLSRDAGALPRFMARFVVPVLVPLLRPFLKFLSTPKRAARVITTVALNEAGATGTYYDDGGRPMVGSAQVRDPKFQDQVLAETRELLAPPRTQARSVARDSVAI